MNKAVFWNGSVASTFWLLAMILVKKNGTTFFWMVVIVCFLLGLRLPVFTMADRGKVDGLIVNEFVAANGTGLADEDGGFSDWIEIYNSGNQAVNRSLGLFRSLGEGDSIIAGR